jgi:hypothetical protein
VARRAKPSTTSKLPNPFRPEIRISSDHALDLVKTVKASNAIDILVETKVPSMPSVLLDSGQYRKKALNADTELIFKGLRCGRRSEFILEFLPVAGMADVTQFEYTESACFAAIPSFEQALINSLGDYDSEDWEQAKKRFFSGFEKRREITEAKERKAAAKGYEDDPLWGIF